MKFTEDFSNNVLTKWMFCLGGLFNHMHCVLVTMNELFSFKQLKALFAGIETIHL